MLQNTPRANISSMLVFLVRVRGKGLPLTNFESDLRASNVPFQTVATLAHRLTRSRVILCNISRAHSTLKFLLLPLAMEVAWLASARIQKKKPSAASSAAQSQVQAAVENINSKAAVLTERPSRSPRRKDDRPVGENLGPPKQTLPIGGRSPDVEIIPPRPSRRQREPAEAPTEAKPSKTQRRRRKGNKPSNDTPLTVKDGKLFARSQLQLFHRVKILEAAILMVCRLLSAFMMVADVRSEGQEYHSATFGQK